MVKRQLDFWAHGTGRWLWWLLVTAPLWSIDAFILFRDGMLRAAYRDIYILQFLPSARVYWHWYVIGELAYVIMVMFFVAPAANTATLRKVKERHRASFRRYREGQAALQLPPMQFVGVPAEPNVIPHEMETVWAKKDDQGFIVKASESDATIRALVIPYKNDRIHPSQRRVGDIENVTSQISWESYDGESFRLTQGPAAWLSEMSDRLRFRRDDQPNELVLATAALTEWSNLNAVQRETATLGKAVREIPLVGSYWRVRVSLHADQEPKPIARSDYVFERDAQAVWGSSYSISGPHLMGTEVWRGSHVERFIKEARDLLRRDYREKREEVRDRRERRDHHEEDRATLNQDYANWQRHVAEFVRRIYGHKDKSNFLLEQTDGLNRTAPPASFEERLSEERLRLQLKVLEQAERLKRQIES